MHPNFLLSRKTILSYDAGNLGYTWHPYVQPFLSGKIHLSVFLNRNLALETTLAQSGLPRLCLIRQKLTDLIMKR